MNKTIIRCTAHAGIGLTICLAVLLISMMIYSRLNLSHPLEGTVLAAAIFLSSPLLLAFQGLALVMTRKCDMTKPWRIAAYLLNGLGALMCSWLVMILVILWRGGPINPG